MLFFRISQKLLFVVFFLTRTFLVSGDTVGPNLDSLREIIKSEDTPDVILYEAYTRLAWELKSISPVSALEYAREALALGEKFEDKEKIGKALSYIGVIYWQQGNFNQALDYHLEANSIYSVINDELGIARSSINIGIIFSDQSYYEKAIEYFFKGLRLYEKNENQQGMAVALNNLGMVYEYQRDFALAEDYHLRSLEIKEILGDKKGKSYSFNNLGLVYQGMQKMDLAADYFYKSLEIRLELNDKREIASTYSNLGYLNYLLHDREKAQNYLLEALRLYMEVDDKSGIAKTHNYLGRLYLQTEELFRARRYFNNSMRIAREIGLTRMVTENYAALARLMAKLNDYQAAYNYQQEFIQLKDSIYSEESRRKIYELQLMYEREQKESELQLLQKNEQITRLSSQRDRLLRNFLVIGVVLTLITLFLIYNRFLIARNANVLLEKQKNEITESNTQLVDLNHNLLEQKKMFEELNHKLNVSNKKLKESERNLMEINSTKDKFFSIISHDLRNPFASIVSFSRILKRDMMNMTKAELGELALELDKSVLKIDNLLENLLQWSRAQTGKIKYRPDYLALHEIVKDNLNLFENNARDKQINLVDKVSDEMVVWADRNMTDTVIRNLLSNALKYTEPEGEIVIESELRNHRVYVSIKDNGVGMSEEAKSKIFRTDALHSTYGTMDEKGSGLGLLLCKEFVEKQGGEITFQSQENEGSVFTFCLPTESDTVS